MGEVSQTQHPHKNQNHSFKRGFFHASLKLDQPLLEIIQNDQNFTF